MDKYVFFYDESEHSRSITKNTLKSKNFETNFVSSIIGFKEDVKDIIKKKYLDLEQPYIKFYCVNELKSEIISKNKYKYGFSTFKKDDLNLIKDVFTFIFENNFKVYISVINKIEYIINQLLFEYKNDLIIDADFLRYSVTKLINVYYPEDVIDSIYNENMCFIPALKKFCLDLLHNNKNVLHKNIENEVLEQLLVILDSSSPDFVFDWNYTISFFGFSKYIKEQKCGVSSLYIDAEGHGNTLNAAKTTGFTNSYEIDSKLSYGVRIADIVAGVISRFIVSIFNSITYSSFSDAKNLKLLDKQWFMLSKDSFDCYRILKKVIIDLNKSWFKTYSSHYSDSFLYFICLLNYIDNYKDFEEFQNDKEKDHTIELNQLVLNALQDRFTILSNKLDIEPAEILSDGTYLNQQGALCYIDYMKHEYLPISKVNTNYYVKSVGFFGRMEKACITIKSADGPKCYLLPDQLKQWALYMVAFANNGINLFPANVNFIKKDKKYYADIE